MSKTEPERTTRRKKTRAGKAEEAAPAAAAAEETARAADESAAGGEPAAPEVSEEDRLRDRLLRLQADFENFRKRTAREKDDLARRANESLLEDLLPVLDHLEMGIRSAEQRAVEPSVIDGFRLVETQFLEAFKRHGVEPILAGGEVFDPRIHECISHLPSAEHPENTIIAETRRGYRIGEYVLRAAQVVVSSGPGDAPAGDDAQGGA
jgi:molecular chaperone GrpE